MITFYSEQYLSQIAKIITTTRQNHHSFSPDFSCSIAEKKSFFSILFSQNLFFCECCTHHSAYSTEKMFLIDFSVCLKHTLQNWWKTWGNVLTFVLVSDSWINDQWLHRSCQNNSFAFKELINYTPLRDFPVILKRALHNY